MTDSAIIDVDLMVIATLFRLVAEEMNGGVVDAGDEFFVCDVLETVGLVPAAGEDVEGDLAADGVAGVWSVRVVVRVWRGDYAEVRERGREEE